MNLVRVLLWPYLGPNQKLDGDFWLHEHFDLAREQVMLLSAVIIFKKIGLKESALNAAVIE